MSFETTFLDLMPHRVKLEPKTSVTDGWGNKAYGLGAVIRGRVIQKDTRIIGATGQDIISHTTVYLATTSGISTEDRITLPSGYVPQQPPILSVVRQSDETGLHHTVVFC